MIDFVEHLADWATGVPLLLLCTARPELYERRPGWGGGKRNSTTVALLAAPADEIAALLSLAAGRDAPARPRRRPPLLERAGGNPLYAEEFVRMLTDRGILQRAGRPGRSRRDGDIPVPDTVQALIAARMDTLSPERKALLHDAAVVGKVFWPGALASMGDADRDDVVNGLHDLRARSWSDQCADPRCRARTNSPSGTSLVRDVAYAQIPRARARRRHRQAAGWIEETAGERVGDHADILAHHYMQALAPGPGRPRIAGRGRAA